jgi:hypothetical protein
VTLLEVASVLFFKGVLLYDRPNSLLLVIETVLFINLNICGGFWGKIGEFGRNWLENRNTGLGVSYKTSRARLAGLGIDLVLS